MLDSEEKEIVQRARARIADPERWCAHVDAQTADGVECSFDDPLAQKFCAFGALAVELLALLDKPCAISEAYRLADILTDGDRPLSLPFINDNGGRDAALAIFDKALAA